MLEEVTSIDNYLKTPMMHDNKVLLETGKNET